MFIMLYVLLFVGLLKLLACVSMFSMFKCVCMCLYVLVFDGFASV